MKSILLAVALADICWTSLLHTQSPAGAAKTKVDHSSIDHTLILGSGEMPASVIREIDDLHTGERWLLLRDPSHPGGPGRLVVAGSFEGAAKRDMKLSSISQLPIIHSGDRVIVEEKTAIVEAHLEAVALAPAVNGARFPARLAIGGKTVSALAVAPGHAILALEQEPGR